MRVLFRESFLKDLRSVREKTLARRLESAILRFEESKDLHSIAGVKRLKGVEGYFRLRIGEYRLGFMVQGDEVTLIRLLDRREIYRYFP